MRGSFEFLIFDPAQHMSKVARNRPRARAFAFTDFVMDKEIWTELVDSGKVVFLAIGEEIAPTTQKKHWQGFIHFNNARSTKAIRKMLSPRHVETAVSSDKENDIYCNKDGKNVIRHGEPVNNAGARTDIEAVRMSLLDGATMRDIAMSCTSMSSMNFGKAFLAYCEAPRAYAPREVIWYYGATGTGKTMAVFDACPEIFRPLSYKWWDGYDGHKTVLVDDIRPEWCTFDQILKLTGEAPFKIETKGGSRQAMYDRIFITSPDHPKDVWATHEDKAQLLDRITIVKQFTGDSLRKRRKLVSKVSTKAVDTDTEVLGNTSAKT